ncbi:hypothetical protein PV327_011569 [Microctonus hyperodae]|uniref:ISXO2-like transposase domain-containing protein n=1 Tax=Microctonus hyperodae TaxID=165561 RepID=A0AA39C2M5_MICHY|nr:hypothetical protein PV327_011569 [Microctonus hyperodae]
MNVTLTIVISFVIGMTVSVVHKNLQALRHHNGDSELSNHTVSDYFSYCRKIAEVIASHTNVVLGGEGKTVQIDETFLTKRKYNRGRITEQMTTTVLGLYCKEDKTGNTINDLENQNKLFKKSIACRKIPKLLHQYMALFWYRRNVLKKFDDDGSQNMQFLLDIKRVYPGYVNGNLQEGLMLKEIDSP